MRRARPPGAADAVHGDVHRQHVGQRAQAEGEHHQGTLQRTAGHQRQRSAA